MEMWGEDHLLLRSIFSTPTCENLKQWNHRKDGAESVWLDCGFCG
jgi:hypothetical protein